MFYDAVFRFPIFLVVIVITKTESYAIGTPSSNYDLPVTNYDDDFSSELPGRIPPSVLFRPSKQTSALGKDKEPLGQGQLEIIFFNPVQHPASFGRSQNKLTPPVVSTTTVKKPSTTQRPSNDKFEKDVYSTLGSQKLTLEKLQKITKDMSSKSFQDERLSQKLLIVIYLLAGVCILTCALLTLSIFVRGRRSKSRGLGKKIMPQTYALSISGGQFPSLLPEMKSSFGHSGKEGAKNTGPTNVDALAKQELEELSKALGEQIV